VNLDELSASRQEEVLLAVAAVESAEQPVAANAFRALADTSLRAYVEDLLTRSGRVLLPVGVGYLSGYDDEIAEQLLNYCGQPLLEEERAVLTVVILFSVAIPRAEGSIPVDAHWTVARPVSRDQLKDSLLPGTTVDAALRSLLDAGIVRQGSRGAILPGAQFLRLTQSRLRTLFDELILLAEPDGALAESIRRSRVTSTTPREVALDRR
jgi:hypothetical protein